MIMAVMVETYLKRAWSFRSDAPVKAASAGQAIQGRGYSWDMKPQWIVLTRVSSPLHRLQLLAFPLSNAENRLRKIYIHTNVGLNISDALIFCKSNYTNLVTVYDKVEDEELQKQIKKLSYPYSAFIGAHTNNTNYTSKWSNGDDVTFTQLNETGGKMEICGAVMRANGSWKLLPYSTTINFMCYDKGNLPVLFILIPLKKNWTEAQLYCRKNHNDLVSIRNERENDIVKNMVKESEFPVWIGLLYDNIEWFDGGQSAYRNYPLGPGYGNWLAISNNNWMKVNRTVHKALCYKSFIHVNKTKMSWEDAQDYCNINAFGLLRIESKKDQIETDRELHRKKISGPVWIGLRQSRLFGFWIWVNGLQVGPWTNWKGGRQPEHQKSNYCGAIEKVNHVFRWSDKDCRSKFRVLCEGK
ncbi:macrophage mannose receptor 1-like [Misgurnus anguillicaudatus]|uniref:macrophage mannose receptor 1-like n=1 Tax=Misgurnus anguillicaudatus TaxID=75329 RepID=UPI003CCF4BD4